MNRMAYERMPASRPTRKWLTRSQKGKRFAKNLIHRVDRKIRAANVTMLVPVVFSMLGYD